jgi:hypothetical protein
MELLEALIIGTNALLLATIVAFVSDAELRVDRSDVRRVRRAWESASSDLRAPAIRATSR